MASGAISIVAFGREKSMITSGFCRRTISSNAAVLMIGVTPSCCVSVWLSTANNTFIPRASAAFLDSAAHSSVSEQCDIFHMRFTCFIIVYGIYSFLSGLYNIFWLFLKNYFRVWLCSWHPAQSLGYDTYLKKALTPLLITKL